MKIIINESAARHIIKELSPSGHFEDRLYQRFFIESYYNVIAVQRSDPSDYMIIGTFDIPQDAKTKVRKIIDFVSDPDYVCPVDTAIVIELYQFDINLNTVKLKHNSFRNMFNNPQWKIYLQETMKGKSLDDKPSSGYYLVCVARSTEKEFNKITTTFLTRTKDFEYIKRKIIQNYGCKEVYMVRNVFSDELTKFIDVDSAKENPLTPKEQPVQNPVEPTLNNKEQRLLAYKERMKQNKK